jgi:hypothetical protein
MNKEKWLAVVFALALTTFLGGATLVVAKCVPVCPSSSTYVSGSCSNPITCSSTTCVSTTPIVCISSGVTLSGKCGCRPRSHP